MIRHFFFPLLENIFHLPSTDVLLGLSVGQHAVTVATQEADRLTALHTEVLILIPDQTLCLHCVPPPKKERAGGGGGGRTNTNPLVAHIMLLLCLSKPPSQGQRGHPYPPWACFFLCSHSTAGDNA